MSEFQHFGTVSHGTMRPDHLINTFSDVLNELDPAKFKTLEAKPIHDEVEDEVEFLEELFDALNECAPEGFYFGAHPGDGSDYGFWAFD